MDYYPATDEKQLVKAGDPCEVMIGEDKVVTGYIDSWNPAINKTQHQIRVSGRGKCQDLVDCSANWENNVISQSNALQIAKNWLAGMTLMSLAISLITNFRTFPVYA